MTRRLALILEWTLYAAAAVLLCMAIGRMVRYQAFQGRPEWFAAAEPRRASAPVGRKQEPAGPSAFQVAGRIEIPRLSLALNVIEGDDEDSLALNAGHVPGSAPLGGTENAVIGGHRDSAFRPLRDIRPGDSIRAWRAGKAFECKVEPTRVVRPDDLTVLHSGERPMLTLITCYPFRFVGDAPNRFIATAKMISR